MSMKQWEKNLNHIGKTELQQISVALIAAQSRSPFRHALGLGLTIVLSKLKNLFNWYKLKIYIYIYRGIKQKKCFSFDHVRHSDMC